MTSGERARGLYARGWLKRTGYDDNEEGAVREVVRAIDAAVAEERDRFSAIVKEQGYAQSHETELLARIRSRGPAPERPTDERAAYLGLIDAALTKVAPVDPVRGAASLVGREWATVAAEWRAFREKYGEGEPWSRSPLVLRLNSVEPLALTVALDALALALEETEAKGG